MWSAMALARHALRASAAFTRCPCTRPLNTGKTPITMVQGMGFDMNESGEMVKEAIRVEQLEGMRCIELTRPEV